MNPQGRLAVALCNIALTIDRVEKQNADILIRLGAISRQESRAIRQGEKAMALLDGIVAEAARQTTLDASIEALVTGLAAQVQALTDQLAAGNVDPALVAQAQALTDQMKAANDSIQAALPANTPAAPTA